MLDFLTLLGDILNKDSGLKSKDCVRHLSSQWLQSHGICKNSSCLGTMLAANMPECTPSTTASVENSEIREEEKKFTVYKVAITSDNDSWFVFRRYNEFYKLFDILRKQVPGLQLKLPGKKLFGNNLDPQFIASRQEGLDMFLQQLMQDRKLLEIPEVRAFLQLDRRKLSSEGDGELDDSNDGVDALERMNKLNLGPSEHLYAKPKDFEFLRVIGKGSYGKVLLARHCSEGKYYAIKILSKRLILRKNEVRHVMAERDILLKNVHHPFLVGLHYSFQTSDKLYFVLDYVNGGEHEVFDLRHIDPEFTREAVSSSVARSHSTTSILTASVREADDIFAGFSYAAPMDL
ncbi:Serine/threonine-protein kinase Sgk3 [Frankliniella fusca]|uniref:non-specific serine/threonine protein kinase n=1 Tax=Frankliniella fusca TaxID=407009 RepID=A0AAE1GWM3_9NEOP|nr:Serine/threonine-protein kinase Sgk3 [Frankliniella fusca]